MQVSSYSFVEYRGGGVFNPDQILVLSPSILINLSSLTPSYVFKPHSKKSPLIQFISILYLELGDLSIDF